MNSYDTLGSPDEASLPPAASTGELMGEESIYFKSLASDGTRRLVDFVLVWEEKPKEPTYFADCSKRATYISQLEEAGLETEEDEDMESKGIDLRFVKLHVPMEVLKRYAEILKLRMKLKASTGAAMDSLIVQQSAEGEDMLEFKLEKEKSPESEFRDPFRMPMVSLQNSVQGSFRCWLERVQSPFYPDPNLFPRHQEQDYTATYSRDKDYLFEDDDAKFFSPAARSRIVEFILQRKRFLPDGADDDFAFGINRLIKDGVYLAAYPLHDGTIETPGSQRQLLSQEWACWSKWWKYQPLDAIRDYFGVKIGLYFAFLGFYTAMLIPPSLVGIVCFLYGVATASFDIPSSEVCGSMANVIMCPTCDEICSTWLLGETCEIVRAKYMFDNVATIVFAVFMSLWSAVFLEVWRRYSAEICHRWDVFGFDPEDDHPRPAYLLQLKDVKPEDWEENFVTREREPFPPFWRMKLPGVMLSWTTVTLLVTLAIITVIAIIFYRISMVAAFIAVDDSHIKSHFSNIITGTGAAINLICILIFNFVYNYVAKWLTEMELHRTQTSFDNSLALKIYLFHSVNCYASIFYA